MPSAVVFFCVWLCTSLSSNDQTRPAQLPQRKILSDVYLQEAATVLEAHDAHLLQQVPI